MTTPLIISTFFRQNSSSLIIKHLNVSGWVQMIYCSVCCCWFIFALTWQASCGSDEATAKYDLNQQSCVQTHFHVCIKGQFFSDVSFNNHFHCFPAPLISFISHSLLFTFQKCCYCNGKCIIMSGGGILQQYWDSIHCSTGCYNLATKDEIIWNVSIKLGCLALMSKNQRINLFMRTRKSKRKYL